MQLSSRFIAGQVCFTVHLGYVCFAHQESDGCDWSEAGSSCLSYTGKHSLIILEPYEQMGSAWHHFYDRLYLHNDKKEF